MKIYFTYNSETRDGYESHSPEITSDIPDDSVDEVIGEGVLEKVPNLHTFIEELYRILKKGEKAKLTSAYYASNRAWLSPLTKRALCEASLNFANKEWREQNKYSEVTVKADFRVDGNFSIEDQCVQRSEAAKLFWLARYNNVIQSIAFTLTKL